MAEWDIVTGSNLVYYTRLISRYLVKKMHWDYVSVYECLSKERLTYPNAIQAKHFSEKGKFPIVSQSKEYISGYSDNENLVINEPLPIIVFGDHTQVIKYVDFPFIIGADGVKLLRPNEDLIPKFFYYMLKGNNIDSNKYARHYALLRNQKVPVRINSKHLQKSIIAFLEDLENDTLESRVYFDKDTEESIINLQRVSIYGTCLSEQSKLQLEELNQLRRQTLQEANEGKLTARWRREHHELISGDNHALELLEKIRVKKEQLIKEGKIRKEQPLAPISDEEKLFNLPEGWAWCRLGDLGEWLYGKGLPKTQRKASGEFPVYGSNGIVGYYNKYLTTKRSIIVGRKGSAGALTKCDTPSWTTDVAFYVEESEFIDFDYFFIMLKSLNLENIGKGIKPGINRNEAYNLLVPLAPYNEQKAMFKRLGTLMITIDKLGKQISERKEQSEMLMQSVLREAFATS